MRSGMFDNTEVYSADFARFAAGLLTNGVLADSTTALQVSAGTGMQVSVAPGYCWINGRFGVAETAETLSIAAADGSLGRVDRVVARLDLSAPSVSLQVIQGEASASPEAPALVRSGNYYDLGLALVSVPAGTLAITSSLITDTRDNADVCGAVIYRNADSLALDTKANAASATELLWEGKLPDCDASNYNTNKTYYRPGTTMSESYLGELTDIVVKRHAFYVFTPKNKTATDTAQYIMFPEHVLALNYISKLQLLVSYYSTSQSSAGTRNLCTASANNGQIYIVDSYKEGDYIHFVITMRGLSSGAAGTYNNGPSLKIYGFGEPIDEV